jgi:Ca2+-binding EF-hand superfamily protein
MKKTGYIALGALIGACSLAAAEDLPQKPDRPVLAALLAKFDTDKDGKLSPDERKAMHEERKAEMLKKFDTDGDGVLSDDEKAAMKAAREAKHAELLAKYDADKDGKLSPAEVKAARDAGEELPMRDGPGGKRGPNGKKPGGPPPAPTAE